MENTVSNNTLRFKKMENHIFSKFTTKLHISFKETFHEKRKLQTL